jgi:hypothetical protein
MIRTKNVYNWRGEFILSGAIPALGDVVVLSADLGTAAGIVVDVWDVALGVPAHIQGGLTLRVEAFLKERGADHVIWICPTTDEGGDRLLLLLVMRVGGEFYDMNGRRLTLTKAPDARWN